MRKPKAIATAAVKNEMLIPGLAMCLLVCFPTAKAADGLGELALTGGQTVSMLADRLTVSVPAGSRSAAIQNGIMSAPETDYDQTRVIIDAGPERMVVVAYEEFARANGSFEDAVKEAASRLGSRVILKKWPLAAPLEAVAFFPAAPTNDANANLVMGLFVAQTDGSVQRLAWYVNNPGARQPDTVSRLAQAIARTVSPGKRVLDSNGGERVLLASSPKSLVISIPQGYTTTMQNGPDFVVHHIRKITRFGDGPASVGIYLGDHPSSRYRGSAQNGTLVLFGTEYRWDESAQTDSEGTNLRAGILVPLGRSVLGSSARGPSFADIFLAAGDKTTLEALKAIAATIRMERK